MSNDLTTGRGVREAFLQFFEARDHKRVRSASLVPGDDPTLLFTNAGMVQFKDVFTGDRQVDYSRATSSQKCLRVSGKHNDLDVVGRTPRHHTFFEMLGNFSFGDYFKEEAIDAAWEFLTAKDWCGLDPERLWASVHHTDDEAYALWRDRIGLPESRLLRLGDKDNFWAMGDTGPCGPCSEIHWDRGPEHGEDLEDRLLEVWNLVFMQYVRSDDGALAPLPRPSVDTGMGLERVCSILQGYETNYDTDLLRSVISRGEALSGSTYGKDGERDLALRVVADHSRATAFLIADGILPGNEGRGYVLRRVMRRAIRFGASSLALDDVFFHETCLAVCDRMGEDYPELTEARALIERVVPQEEELFRRTLGRGQGLIDQWSADKQDGAVMPGEVAFRLYDTYGFPVDLTRLIGEEQGFTVDEEGFEAALEVQRETGRAARKGTASGDAEVHRAILDDVGTTEFLGYQGLVADGVEVAALLRDGARIDRAEAGEAVSLFVLRTPFYGESGGQVGDIGWIRSEGARMKVVDTQRALPELFEHRVEVVEGAVKVGDAVVLEVDAEARTHTVRNHSGTHLLHHALRSVLGPHVRQRGSLVAPGRLRFDFSHFEPVPRADLDRIESIANELVLRNEATVERTMPYDDAVAAGALAFFGDKYGDDVRTVRISDSLELCGGTHVGRSGDIGFIKVLGEGGIQAGVRRIEAVTGAGAMRLLQQQANVLHDAADLLHASPLDALGHVERLLRQQKELEREVEQLKQKIAASSVDDLLGQAQDVNGVKVLAARAEGVEARGLRDLGDRLRDRLDSGVLMLGTDEGGKAALLCMVTRDLTGRLKAGDLVREAAKEVGGRGGGRPDMAQAGGPEGARLQAALDRFVALVGEAVGG